MTKTDTENPAGLAAAENALRTIRAPLAQGEYDLHALVAEALGGAGLAFRHEAVLGPRCRIDFLCGGVGIEVKRGKPERARLTAQLRRYAATGALTGLIVVSESYVRVPPSLDGVPVRLICLNRLWGIAL